MDKNLRGHHIGEQLVQHCIDMAEQLGFRILQFNAVVRSNRAALALYRKLGFVQLGIIPGGFRLNDGSYEDIIPHYYLWGRKNCGIMEKTGRSLDQKREKPETAADICRFLAAVLISYTAGRITGLRGK